jgi:hypothetical protein
MTVQPQPHEPVLDLSRRDERALSMRVAGIPIERVAATFGWTPEQAQEAVERALVRVTVDRNPEGVKHQRNLTQRRLDGLLEAIYPSATDPTGHPIIQQNAIRTALSVIDRQTNLFGTNAPKETVVTHNVGPDQVAATIERLFAARSGVVEADVLGAIEGSGPEIIDAEVVEDE